MPLTRREPEVPALLAEGASNKVIAIRLGISVHTATFNVGPLLDKLDAVAQAARIGGIHLCGVGDVAAGGVAANRRA